MWLDDYWSTTGWHKIWKDDEEYWFFWRSSLSNVIVWLHGPNVRINRNRSIDCMKPWRSGHRDYEDVDRCALVWDLILEYPMAFIVRESLADVGE